MTQIKTEEMIKNARKAIKKTTPKRLTQTDREMIVLRALATFPPRLAISKNQIVKAADQDCHQDNLRVNGTCRDLAEQRMVSVVMIQGERGYRYKLLAKGRAKSKK